MRKAIAIVVLTLALPAWAAAAKPISSKSVQPSGRSPVHGKVAGKAVAPAGKKPTCAPPDGKPAKAAKAEVKATKPADPKSAKANSTKSAKAGAAKPAPVPAILNEVAKPTADDPDRERLALLQQALEEVVRGKVLGRLRVGMQVEDLATGRALFGWRSSALMDPASNQKVLATTAALLRLGTTFRYRTEVTGGQPDADGKITGDIVVRGNGDPSLRYRHVEALAEDLAAKGVTRVTGSVLGDPRRLDSDEVAPGGRPPLRVGSTSIEVHVRPADKIGGRPLISLRPASDAFVVVNQAETRAKGKGRIGVSLERAGNRVQVVVTGKIVQNRGPVVVQRGAPSHPLFAAILLRQALIQAGIAVQGNAGIFTGDNRSHVAGRPSIDGVALAATEPSSDSTSALLESPHVRSTEILALHESEPLPVLLRRVNKDSDNEWAERVLETVGAEVYGGAPTTAKGVRALRDALADLGLSLSSYLPSNGSGLGHQNRVTAGGMIALLRQLYFDPRIGPDLMQSLSVGGVDGTTRNRFRGSSAAHRVRAKTGTLNGVSCLSGFVGDGSEILAFSILVEGHRNRAVPSVRAAQVSAVNAMMRFARRAAGPVPEEELVPGSDFETGEEADETDNESTEKSDPEHVVVPAAIGSGTRAP